MKEKKNHPISSILLIVYYIISFISISFFTLIQEVKKELGDLLPYIVFVIAVSINIIGILRRAKWARIYGIVLLTINIILFLISSIFIITKAEINSSLIMIIILIIMLIMLLCFFGFSKRSIDYYDRE